MTKVDGVEYVRGTLIAIDSFKHDRLPSKQLSAKIELYWFINDVKPFFIEYRYPSVLRKLKISFADTFFERCNDQLMLELVIGNILHERVLTMGENHLGNFVMQLVFM